MTAAGTRAPAPSALLRAAGFLRDLAVGGLLCLTPLTSLLALGWLTRHMAAASDRARGRPAARPGWVLGRRGRGLPEALIGGLSANVRAGLITGAGLAVWTLPHGALWLGAWWAGWENSFNKGYEQAFVGPAVWFGAALPALLILAHLPMILAHAASENRPAAFFELRRIRALTTAARWRIPALAALSVILALPFLASRALPVFVEEIVPGFADLSATDQMQVAQTAQILTAGYAFAALMVVRTLAARIHARAVRVLATGTAPARVTGWVWTAIAAAIWFGVVAQIVVGQFMNYDGVLWLTHPFTLLPWIG